MDEKDEGVQHPDCEFSGQCDYAPGCHCQGVEKEQCLVLSDSSNLLEVNRGDKPLCSATVFFGFVTSFCRCRKRQKRAKSETSC